MASTLPGRGAENGGLSYYLNGTTKTLVNGTAPAGATVYDDGMIFNGVYENGAPNTTVLSAQEYYKASYNISEAYIYSSTFVKMREIKLAYNFNKSFAKNWD